MRRLRKPRFLLTYPLVVALFIFGHSTEGRLLWGSFVVLLGEALRLWANGYVGHKKVNRSPRPEGNSWRSWTQMTSGSQENWRRREPPSAGNPIWRRCSAVLTAWMIS